MICEEPIGSIHRARQRSAAGQADLSTFHWKLSQQVKWFLACHKGTLCRSAESDADCVCK